MWNNYFSGRPKRDIPQHNYKESSSEDEEDEFVSPSRPPVTRAGSPAELAIPQLNDNVDEELEKVSATLKNVGHTPLFRSKFKDEPEEEVVNEGLVVGEGEVGLKADDSLNMANEQNQNQAVDFEDENAADGEKAIEYSRTLKIDLDPAEIEFWFTQIENEMFTCGIKSQWMKRVVLVKNLPAKMQADVKSLLVLKQSAAPVDIYKKVKTELLRIHAPKEEETYKKALTRVLVGLPSQLGQVLISDVCNKPVKLEGCCCSRAVWTLWNIQLPLQVRSQIADEVFNHTTYMAVFRKADKIYLSTKSTEMSAGVAAIAAQPQPEGPEVAAFKPKPSNKGGNGGGGGNNNGGGGGNKKPPKNGTKPRPSVPDGCCANHKKWAGDAWFCLDPTRCPPHEGPEQAET